jgi:hypothetical protein
MPKQQRPVILALSQLGTLSTWNLLTTAQMSCPHPVPSLSCTTSSWCIGFGSGNGGTVQGNAVSDGRQCVRCDSFCGVGGRIRPPPAGQRPRLRSQRFQRGSTVLSIPTFLLLSPASQLVAHLQDPAAAPEDLWHRQQLPGAACVSDGCRKSSPCARTLWPCIYTILGQCTAGTGVCTRRGRLCITQ